MRRLFVTAAVALFAGIPASALAQATGFDAQQFNPAPSQTTNLFNVHQARILAGSAWEAGLVLNHASNPLVVTDGEGSRQEAVISSQTAANILGAYGIADRMEIGFDIPLVLSQSGDDLSTTYPGFAAPDAGFGVGDIRIVPAFMLMDAVDDELGGIALTFILNTYLPTGNADVYQGGEMRVEPKLAFDFVLPTGPRLTANAGYMMRLGDDVELDNLEVNDGLAWGLGADVPLGATRALHLIGEFNGEATVAASEINSEEMPLEAIFGAKYFMESGLMAQGGLGVGIVNGYGTPDWRLLAGIAMAPSANPDRDGDGILNDDDVCPDEPEDIDGFEDADGCPELDNDNDGILDVDDACVMDPEDPDGWQDDDGCPDIDNDNDGILDGQDGCPETPEDLDGYQDADGCPEDDNDGDGILDINDGERDANGFGVCRGEAEDPDGYQDEDGCPEPDNDNDGILDGADECEMDPEDFDGYEDADGCPEEGSGAVQLTCDAIEIAETVQFRTDSDEIREASYELLDQVAGVLRSVSYITLVRVEGHTDDRGSDEHNLDLSQRRAAAVMNYLIAAGVEPSRLTSEGYGEARPIADNDTRDGRAINRRVDFVIVEQDSACE